MKGVCVCVCTLTYAYRLLENIEYSPLCYTVDPYCLPILYRYIIYTVYILTPKSKFIPPLSLW